MKRWLTTHEILSVKIVISSLELVDLGLDSVEISSLDLVDLSSSLEELESWHAADSGGLSSSSVLINIDLHEDSGIS